MTHLLNIIFDDFGIWLQGYEIEFSCRYISHVALKYKWILCYVLFWVKVQLKVLDMLHSSEQLYFLFVDLRQAPMALIESWRNLLQS